MTSVADIFCVFSKNSLNFTTFFIKWLYILISYIFLLHCVSVPLWPNLICIACILHWEGISPQCCHPLILSLSCVCQNVPDCFMKAVRGWFCAGRAGISLNLCMILCAVDQTPVKWVLNHMIRPAVPKTETISKPVSCSLWSLALFTFRIYSSGRVCVSLSVFLPLSWTKAGFPPDSRMSTSLLKYWSSAVWQHVDFIYNIIIILPWEMLHF